MIMKNILNEISRIKTLMFLKEQEDEITDTISGAVVIGDQFANMVSDSFQTIPDLVDDDMTINLLFKRLSSSDTIYENVNDLILSIGTVDFFKGVESVGAICDLIGDVFPNANLYVFKGVISDFDFKDQKDIDSVNEAGDIYYDEFEICGFEIIGDYPVVSDSNIGLSNPAVLDLIEFIGEISVMDDLQADDLGVKTQRAISDEETDFDTIYEFLDQFEQIYKSNRTYGPSMGHEFRFDIEQIQITLNFLIDADLDIDGDYDHKTEEAVKSFQRKNGLEATGLCDENTLEEMFYKLKIKGFDDDDLSMFIKGAEDIVDTLKGILDISGAGLSSEQRQNVELLIRKMEDAGITNPYTQVGILSVIGKESGFVPVDEIGYCGSDDSRIITVFGNDRGEKCKGKKCKDDEFFECVYGKDSGATLGNTEPGDGYKYIGRGFNGITGRANYRAYGYEGNPEDLNNVENAAEVAIKFFTKGGAPEFKNKKSATEYFVNKNAGGSTRFTEALDKALDWASRFDVK